MTRHLYKRTLKKNDKEISVWYYWYYDETGKQVRKSCGKAGKPCILKREAEAFLAKLEIQDQENERKKNEAAQVRFQDIANTMFNFDSNFMKLQIAHGSKVKQYTLDKKNWYLEKIINPIFGDRIPATIDSAEIENFLLNLDYGNSAKNAILNVINEVMQECLRNKIITSIPFVKCFKRNPKKKNALTIEEIQKLFPIHDFTQLSENWSTKFEKQFIGKDGNTYNYGLMFGILFYTALTTGMRSGEICALTWKQITDYGIIINQKLNYYNQIDSYLKLGDENNPKHRVVIIPQETRDLLNKWKTISPFPDFLFMYKNKPVCHNIADNHFRLAMVKNGYWTVTYNADHNPIYDKHGLNVSIHSLRVTYNTYMVHNNFSPEALRQMVGHNSQAMTDYYTRFMAEDQLQGLQVYKDQINKIWSLSDGKNRKDPD